MNGTFPSLLRVEWTCFLPAPAPRESAAVPPLLRLPRGRHQRRHDRPPPQRRRRFQLRRRPNQQAAQVTQGGC